MEQEIQQEILKRVDLLANKIGATGSELFASYVEWVQIEPWAFFVGATTAFVFLAIGVLSIFIGTKKNKEERENTGTRIPDDGDIHTFFGALLSIIMGIVFLVLIGCFVAKIPNLYAPKKAAFEEFSKDLRRLAP